VKSAIYIFVGTNHICGMAEARVVKFCTQIDYDNSQHKDNKPPLKGTGSVSCDPLLNFGGPSDICGTAEARIVTFGTQVDCIKS